MASLIEELITTLETETEIYGELIPVAEKKTKVIIKNDLKELQTVTAKEQEAVDRITALEKKREEVVKNIEIVLSKKTGSLNLKEIIQILNKQPKEQKKLAEIRTKLKAEVARLADINIQNQALIQESLDMIEFHMNLIQSTRMSPGNNYTKGAETADMLGMHSGLFDAKQ